ncbi:MAG: hypothetical protein AAGG08_06995 [Actinomycetota bacterium]
MTIRPNEEWGTEVTRPDGLVIAADDAALAAALADRDAGPIAVGGGDLARTLGARPIADRTVLRAFPIDLLRVQLDDDRVIPAIAHVVVRRPWSRGGWWRGPVTLVMNAEFLGEWDVATRGHPNDGRVERFDLDPTTGVRQRRAIARRLPNGSHLPHPAITRTTKRRHELAYDRPVAVIVDGVARGPSRAISIQVDADAATLYA